MGKLQIFSILMLILAGAFFAQASVDYINTDITSSRSLEVKENNVLNPQTGAASPQNFLSTITLSVKNNAQRAKGNVIIEEDLAYIPLYSKIIYSQDPFYMDGRKAKFKIDSLRPGEEISIKIIIPAQVKYSAFSSAAAPRVTYDSEAAKLIAPSYGEEGTAVLLKLYSDGNIGIGGATIEISTPDGKTMRTTTDAAGFAKYTPPTSGIYTYRVLGYKVGAIMPTEIAAAQIAPATTNTLSAEQAKPVPGKGLVDDNLIGIITLVVGIVLLGGVAFALFSHLSRAEEEMPLPPAPPTRPMIDDEKGIEIKPRHSSLPSGLASHATTDAQMKMEQDDSTAYETAIAQNGDATSSIEEETRKLIMARKAAQEEKESQEPGEDEAAREEDAEDEKPQAPSQEIMPLDDADDEEEEKPQGEIEIVEPEEQESSSAGKNLLKYQVYSKKDDGKNDYEAIDDEDEEIDDEAIRKTIQELEELRAQLSAKPSADEKRAGENESEDEAPASEESEGQGSFAMPIISPKPKKLERMPKAAKKAMPKAAKASKKPAPKKASARKDTQKKARRK